MGCCGGNKKYDNSNPSELYITDIISKLRIRKIKAKDLLTILDNSIGIKYEKYHLVEIFKDYLCDMNEKENPYFNVHSQLIDIIIDNISDYSDKNEICLKFFPLFKTNNESQKIRVFQRLLTNSYGKQISLNILFGIIQKYFEFYSFKTNNIVIYSTTNEDLIYHSTLMINTFYDHACIDKAVEKLIEDFKKLKLHKDNFVQISEIKPFFDENKVLCFESLRDYLINVKVSEN